MVEFGGKVTEKRVASTTNDDGIFAKELEDTLMIFTTNNQGHSMNFTTNNQGHRVGANLVDRTEKIIKTEVENSDATECSSSFDGSDSTDFHSDAESDFDSNGLFKLINSRRKLSPVWMKEVHPVMWRCKWLELQICKLKAQYKKYDRKLEEFERISTLQGDGTKSLTFPQPRVSYGVRRKKRRRAEATNDVKEYMSNHNIFSYFETMRKPISEDADRASKNPVKIDYEFSENGELVGSKDGNDEEILEHTMRMIQSLHSQVVEMRTRLGKVTHDQGGQICGTDNLGSRNSSSIAAYGMSMGTYIASQLLSEYNQGAVLLPGSAVTAEVAGGCANGSNNYAYSTYEFDDDVLIDNRRVMDELGYLDSEEQAMIPTIQRQTPLVIKDEFDTTTHLHAVATKNQMDEIDLDRAILSLRSMSSGATTSTKTTNNNRRPKRKGRAG